MLRGQHHMAILAALVSMGISAFGQTPHHDGVGVHGMVLFGRDTLHASHVPMFSEPHAWQALFDVELAHPSEDLSSFLQVLLPDGLQRLATLRPERFSLPHLLHGHVDGFRADVHLGNFERGGPVLLEGVQVRVKRVVVAQPLRTDTAPLPELAYYALGRGMDTYLVHRISTVPGFDHIAQVRWSEPQDGGSITFPGRADAVDARLVPGQRFVVDRQTWSAQPGDEGELTFTVVADVFCALGPDFFEECR